MSDTTEINKSFAEATGHELRITSQLRLFDIMLDTDRSTKFMNIFKSLRINTDVLTDVSLFQTYEVEGEAWWDNISMDIYGTPNLWWIVALFNDVTNPFEELTEGTNLFVLKPDHLYSLFKDIEGIAEL